MNPTAGLLVQTTCTSAEEARSLAHALVEARLAACAQVVPIDSVYRWHGEIEDAHEWRLDIKTAAWVYPALEERILQIHSYNLPEITAVPLSGSAAYLGWIADQVA